MELSAFLPYVLPQATGCPEELAELNIRLALIELCRKGRVWREYQTAVPTVADQTAYAYSPGVEQQIVELLSLELDGVAIDVVDQDTGKARDRNGWISTYAYGGLSGFELRPAQAEDLGIITYSVVCPTLDATEVPDDMARYAEQIGRGTLSRLLKIKDRPFTDKAEAERLAIQWQRDIGEAQTDASKGNVRVKQRTSPHWF